MNKILLVCLLSLFSITSCSKTEKIVFPRNESTMMVTLNECPNFVSDVDFPLKALIIACQSANFEHLLIHINTINDEVYVIHVYGQKGSASIWVDTAVKTCIIEFCNNDDTYSYPDFIATFMMEFDAIEHPDKTDKWLEELMDMCDAGTL